ncbi:MAG: hypothetical protein [Caudoviricetes sp.]|nr:MAG: hypothetical protein [Caudoviricetes sp.]
MIIHTSGIFSDNAGGYASIIFHNNKAIHVTVGQGSTSLLQMQLLAVIEGIKLGLMYLQKGDLIQLSTDSREVFENCENLPMLFKTRFVGLRNVSMLHELYSVMKIAGDRLYVEYSENEYTRNAANLASRMSMSDYCYNPDSYPNTKTGIQIK